MYLEKENGFKSYSFKILQDESLNYFKNLIVSDFTDGTIGVEVVKFNLDKSLEQVKVEGNLKESIISREVSRLSNTTNFVRYDCITVGYYTTVDRCEGELVTPEERPEWFNADGTRAKKEVFITLAEECGFEGSGGTSYDGITVGDPHSGIENGGGGYYSGIFIPNPFEGEPDLNNASFVLAGKISTYLNGLKSNNVAVKNLLNSHYWIYPLIVQFVNEKSPNGSFTEELKQTVTFALENATQVFNLNSQYWSFAEINQYKYNAFLTLLKNPNPSTVAIQQQFIDFFNNNPDANVSVSFVTELINVCSQNNSSITFDNSLTSTNSINFDSVQDFQEFMEQLKNNINITSTFIDGDTKVAKFKIAVNFFTDFNVEVQQTLNPFSVQNVSSNISGTTFALSYEQTTPNDGAEIISMSENLKKIKFSGNLNLNVFIEGIGTIHTYHLTFLAYVNSNTGQPVYCEILGLP